jgi:hypothetical protein
VSPKTVLSLVAAALLAWLLFLMSAFSGSGWEPVTAVLLVWSMAFAVGGILEMRRGDA